MDCQTESSKIETDDKIDIETSDHPQDFSFSTEEVFESSPCKKTMKSSNEDLSSGLSNSKKKKKRRRRRRGPSAEVITKPLLIYSPAASPSGSLRLLQQSSPSYGISGSTPVLRPFGAQVPRAPENSTQFIMDDHENSCMYYGFDGLDPTSGEYEMPDDRQESKSSSPMYKYTVADFESEYRIIREEEMMRCTSDELKTAIVRLEARAAVITDVISASPSRLLERLQAQLLALQEENKSLHATIQREKQKREETTSTSSSSDTSDSDSSSSDSSACSHTDCEECLERNRARDEEKENTSPKIEDE